jgi:hypothetical protein
VKQANPEQMLELELLHRSSGRLRVRAGSLKGRPEALEALATAVAELPDVRRVATNPATGSVLILHDAADSGPLLARLYQFEVFRRAQAPNLSVALASRFAEAGNVFEHAVGVPFDLRAFGVVALLGMAVAQVARGNLTVPATTALWYALQLLPEQGRGQDLDLNV